METDSHIKLLYLENILRLRLAEAIYDTLGKPNDLSDKQFDFWYKKAVDLSVLAELSLAETKT